MSQSKKTEAKDAAQPVAKISVPKQPKKLIPRTAPTVVVPAVEVLAEPIVAPLAAPTASGSASLEAAPAPVAKPAVRRVRKVNVEHEATSVRHKNVVSEALAKAMAAKISQPLGHPAPVLPKTKKLAKDGKPDKSAKPAKPKKIKLVRDSYAMPEEEYAVIGTLKKRLAALGNEFKKSELLRGGMAALAALSDAELLAVMSRVHKIKTGRPAK